MSKYRSKSGAKSVLFKIIMVGDAGTGKSCILVRYTKDEFAEDYAMTVGSIGLYWGV